MCFTNQTLVAWSIMHTLNSNLSIFDNSECWTVSQSKWNRGSWGSSLSVSPSTVFTGELLPLRVTFLSFSLRTVKPQPWDTSACPQQPLGGRLASLAEYLPPRASESRGNSKYTSCDRVVSKWKNTRGHVQILISYSFRWICDPSAQLTSCFLFPPSKSFSYGLQQMSLFSLWEA